jgi:uncharacterized protein (DUF2252 family)
VDKQADPSAGVETTDHSQPAEGRPAREKRKAAGKALRDKCPRRVHATWKPHAERRDPIELLIESAVDRMPQLLPIRYGRMMQSPFVFYRGAAAIMAADLVQTPVTGVFVQACGDCHLLNFGGFATPERNVVFDINDFDETLPAPWEWDVKRLATSCVIAGQHNGFNKTEAREMAVRCVESYRTHIKNFAQMSVMERWYARISADDILGAIRMKKWREQVEARLAKATARTALEDDFPKLASVESGTPRIKDNPPLIFHETIRGAEEYAHAVQVAFRKYRETLSDVHRELLDRFEMKDIAYKVVGVGSVGTYCAILLMMDAGDDVLFLQVKEARKSVLEPYAGKSRYANRGHRVVAGQRLMQAASDIFLGWTEESGRHYYVRQLRDVKIKALVDGMDAIRLGRYAEWCGWALARAHSKSGDAAMISGYLGSNSSFDEAVAQFALRYAEQNERDHKALLRAIRDGRIQVYQE